jgi:hypothetical protein
VSKRAEELLGVDGDVAALRVLLSNLTPAEKQAELARLAKMYRDAIKATDTAREEES